VEAAEATRRSFGHHLAVTRRSAGLPRLEVPRTSQVSVGNVCVCIVKFVRAVPVCAQALVHLVHVCCAHPYVVDICDSFICVTESLP